MFKRICLKSRRFSASISFEKKSEENVLKWLAFSANSISFLPVFIGSDPPNERDLLRRASSAEILTPRHLNTLLATATLPRKGKMMPPPGAYELDAQADAFRATLLWEKIVIHLERTVKCGRRTQGLRTFDDCFLGSKAVDCLTAYLNTILPKTIKRSQVRVLCQRLQLTGVIEDVKSSEKTVFREGRLYRFTGNHFWQADVDGQCAIPRSWSAEHVFKDCRPTTTDPSMHSKGYASDSTLGPASIVAESRHRMARPLLTCKPSAIKGPQLQCHGAVQSGRLGKNTAAVSRPIQAVDWSATSGFISKQTFLETSTRKAEGSISGGKLSRKPSLFQRDVKHKQIASPPKESFSSRSSSSKDLEKRYSLQMRESMKAKERDFAMSSYRNEVRQRVVTMNRSLRVHRSHSFSSDASSASEDTSKKWVVYGFV